VDTVRRRLGLLLIPALVVWPGAVGAQPAAQTARIGFLWGGALPQPLVREFEAAMRERGWEAGRNLVIEHRVAEGRNERLNDLADELVRADVRVILTSQSTSTIAAKKASSTIPIVMLGNGDPVRYGLVTNLARPEANVTGISFLVNEMAIKTVELLKQVAPKVERLAVFVNPTNPGAAPILEDLGKAAPLLGVKIRPVEVSTVEELDRALAALQRERVDAFFLGPEAFIGLQRRRIVDVATANRWPAVSPSPTFLDAGTLLSYGPPFPTIYRQAAVYTDKLLRGAKPADLPVEDPSKFELILNQKAAAALGLTIPPSLVLRADRVIQ
jgi:putative tryptophan/tyrosine transport system substrate-binding protein